MQWNNAILKRALTWFALPSPSLSNEGETVTWLNSGFCTMKALPTPKHKAPGGTGCVSETDFRRDFFQNKCTVRLMTCSIACYASNFQSPVELDNFRYIKQICKLTDTPCVQYLLCTYVVSSPPLLPSSPTNSDWHAWNADPLPTKILQTTIVRRQRCGYTLLTA